jgi:L-lactate dehydrogenase complex protein LldE
VRVQLFVTCLVDLFTPGIGERTVSLLERLGCEVEFPAGQTCCGQPAHNSGARAAAGRVGEHWREVFAADVPVVAPFGSCVHHVRETLGAGNVHDLAGFIVDVLGHETVGGRWAGGPVAWHDECHLLRGTRTAAAARWLLGGVEGCEVVQTERADLCCGFGGTFSLKKRAVSAAMADEKIDRALAAGATAIVSTDPGCLLHLEARARRRGLELRALHLVDLLEPEGHL